MQQTQKHGSAIFEELESNVRGYSRSYPAVFVRAKNARLYDESGNEYIDFLAGAGTLSYGHNNPRLKRALLRYIEEDGITHGLDLYTGAKRQLLETMDELVFRPRELSYKVQFTGPTGTNAVEAALKIARNVTGRTDVVAFTHGFHGVTLGSVAATSNAYYRDASGVPLSHVSFMPYDGYFGEQVDTMAYFERMLLDRSSGLGLPAAVIVETIQGEGGVNEAGYEWLRKLERICNAHGIVLIVDDIQVGCGRTGRFFSFEEAQITPDIVTLSKSLSGYGLPLSVVLIKPHLDIWEPGQHNGTFRGNNLAFLTAAEMLRHYWRDRGFSREIEGKSRRLRLKLQEICESHRGVRALRGRGMMLGLECARAESATNIQQEAFRRGLIVETCGSRNQVVKFLPPLTIENETLDCGLEIFEQSAAAVFSQSHARRQELAGKRS